MDGQANIAEEFECSICMDALVDNKNLPCGHSFCKECQLNMLEFQDGGSAILKCPQKCSSYTTIQADKTLDDVLQKIFILESALKKIRSQSDLENVYCQEEHKIKIPSSRYCKSCRKTLCKSCFDEHPCGDGNNHISIAFDHQKKSFQPICEEHKAFARHICRECNDQLICIYCKHRRHKVHDFVDLDSHINEIKRDLTAKTQQRQPLEKMIEHFQEFREKLSGELLIRKIIRVNRFIAKENEEESNILKLFDDHVTIVTDETYESATEMKNILDEQNAIHKLVLISEQEALLRKLQDISDKLSSKIVLSDLTDDNHLGELQIDLHESETNSLHVEDVESPCKIIKANVNEMTHSTDVRNGQKFLDEIMKKCQKFTSKEDINAIIKSGQDVTILKLALTFGPILSKASDFLYVAVKENQPLMLEVILECKNVDVHTKYNGITALMLAARDGHSECVKLLLQHNCDIDIENEHGNTALIIASDYGHSECVKLLLEHNCDIDMKNEHGNTALIIASDRGHSECVKLLLEHNCDIDIENEHGNTALIHAYSSYCTYSSSRGRSECVKLLKQYMK